MKSCIYMTLFQKSLTNWYYIRPQKHQKECSRWYCRSKTPLGATPKYEKRYVFTKTSMFHKTCLNYCSAGPLPPKTPALLNKSIAHCLKVQSHKLHAFAVEQATTISKYWRSVYDCIVVYGSLLWLQTSFTHLRSAAPRTSGIVKWLMNYDCFFTDYP